MNKDRLLSELGDLARQEGEAEKARLDERWDRLAAGTLTAEEEAELKALAESSPEARETYEAFRPLGADFQARMVSAINAERAAPAPQPAPPEPPPRILPFRAAVRRIEVWLGAAAAVVASLFFLVRGPALPLSSGYEASLDGGFKTDRGDEAAPSDTPRGFGPGSPFTLNLRPKQPLKDPGEVRPSLYLSSSGGREDLSPLRLEAHFQTAETGSVFLDATMGKDIRIPPGNWILWTVVARPHSLPKVDEIQSRLRPKRLRQGSWHAVCEALKAEEKPTPASWQVACTDLRVED
jgi:hypothetical protein